MLNIKDCGLSNHKKWKKVVAYDDHKYKSKELLSSKDDGSADNICLVDNTKEFEQDIANFKRDLRAANAAEKDKKLFKTKHQINKKINEAEVMRTFRIAINTVELNKLNDGVLDENERKNNIIDYYQKHLNTIVDLLENKRFQNHKNHKKIRPKIVKADIHFDQTAPHIHIHLSNIYTNYHKTLGREKYCNNTENTDLIRTVLDEKKIFKNEHLEHEFKGTIWDFYMENVFLKNEFQNQNYKYTNSIDYKFLFPRTYDPRVYKLLNLELEGKFEFWREDKKNMIRNADLLLTSKLNLRFRDDLEDLDKNHIAKLKMLNNVAEYCFYQSLALKVLSTEKYELSNEQLKEKIDNLFEKEHKNNFANVKRKVFEPEFLKREFDKVELKNVIPHLKETEELLNLNRLKNHNELTQSNHIANTYERLFNRYLDSRSEQNELKLERKISNVLEEYDKVLMKNFSATENENTYTLLVEKRDTENRFILEQTPEGNERILSYNQFIQEKDSTFMSAVNSINVAEKEYENSLSLSKENDLSLDLSYSYKQEKTMNYNTANFHDDYQIKHNNQLNNALGIYEKAKRKIDANTQLTDKQKEELKEKKLKELKLKL